MKLKLFFNEISPIYAAENIENDVILLHNGTFYDAIQNVYSINTINIERGNYVNGYQHFLDSLSENKQINSQIKNIIIGHSNGFFNCILIELIKWVETINLISTKYIIEEIIFSDFVDSGSYVPFYESEGEVNRGLFYENYDFIPYNLALIYRKNYKITIVNQHSKFKLAFRIFIRRYILLIAKVIIQLYHKFKSLSFKTDKNNFEYIKENHKLFISRGIAHTDFMKNYVTDPSNNVSLLVGEGLFNFGKNLNKANLYGLKNIFIEKKYQTISYHFASFFEIINLLLKKRNHRFIVKFKDFDLDISSAISEFIIHHYDVLLHKLSIENIIIKIESLGVKNISLFTGEFYGGYAYSVGEIGKLKKFESFQLQNFVCDKVEDVSFLNCKNILFHSKSEQEKFSNQYPTLKNNLLFWGNIRYGKLDFDLRSIGDISQKKILYFTQPILFSEEQNLILNHLLKLKDSKIIDELALKIHPRENKSSYEVLASKGVEIYDGHSIIDNLLPNFTIGVLQTSAVGQQLVLSGMPVIICQISESTQQITADFIANDYYGKVENLDQLTERIENYSGLVNSFKDFRKQFILQNSLYHNIEYFNQEFENQRNN